MAATAMLRIYYGWLTSAQPVWWDEAEYLVKAKSLALGTPVTGYFTARPPLLPIVLAGFFRLGLSEIAIRVFLLTLSQVTVYLTYRIGLLTFGPGAALVSAWLFGLCYLPLFFSMRVMTETPQLALVLISCEQLLTRRRGWAVWSAAALSLAVFTRYPAALMFLPYSAYLAVTQKAAALRDRQNYLFLAVAALVAVPFLWASWVTYGDALHQLHASAFLMPTMDVTARLAGVKWYSTNLWHGLGVPIGAVAALSIGVAAYHASSPRHWKGPAPRAGRELLLLLWILVPTFYFCGFVRPMEERYLILTLPAVFIAAGRLLMTIANHLSRFKPWVGNVAVAGFLTATTPGLISTTRASVVGYLDSYGGLKNAGRWLSRHLEPEDVVVSKSVAQLTYYTSHAISGVPESLDEFEHLTHTGIDYLVLTAYEKHPAWLDTRRLQSLGFVSRVQFREAGQPAVFIFESREH